MERVKLDRDQVKKLFEEGTHQAEVMIGLYKLVYPEWDRIEKIEGWPTCTRKTGNELCGMFMKFDEKHHPDVMKGGIWLNNGFSTCEIPDDLADWEVIRAPFTVKDEV